MIRIILVDQAEQRARFHTVIAAHPHLTVVGEAEHGGTALDLVATRQPDVVVMQALMPVVNGVAATWRIRATCPTVQVVFLAPAFTDTVAEGIRAGAISYLRTDADAEAIVQTLRAAHQVWVYPPPLPPTSS